MTTTIRRKVTTLLAILVLGFGLAGPVSAEQTQVLKENPSFFAMTGDLLLARPLMLATTAVGAVVFAISSPFAAMGGNIKQSARTLVKEPFNATFKRCLGCSFPEDNQF